MDANIERRLFFQGCNCRLSSINKNTAYYKSSRYDSAIFGIHVCSEIAAIFIPSEIFDVELEVFLNNFMHEKALCLYLYPQQIYQTLFLRLREKYTSQPYHIPSKRKIYGIIRELRRSMFANSIQAA
ncbi:hypothetical protein MXB_3823 [Myxobolus squamalis]|nr:hypothetical protein MXB_3823 [Myxobolus squamalis]